MAPFTRLDIPDSFGDAGTGARRIHVPEGDYLGEIQAVVPSPESVDAEKAFFSYRTLLVDGPQQGVGQVYAHMASFGDTAGWTHNIVAAAGVNPASLKGKKSLDYAAFCGIATALDKALKGRKVGIVMADNTYQNTVTSRAVQFYPAAQFVKREPVAAPASPNGSDLEKSLTGLLGNTGL